MKQIIPLIIAAVLCLSATGCATYSALNAVDTGTAVSSANFHYVKSVEGEASSTYILGLFGSNQAQKAIDDAKQKAGLQDNQALVNVSVVNTQRVILGLIIKINTKVSADVIEFEK